MIKQQRDLYKKQIEILSEDISTSDVIFKMIEDDTDVLITFITEDGRSLTLPPYDFCQGFFVANCLKADKMKLNNGSDDLIEQAKLFMELKGHFISFIQHFNAFTAHYDRCKKYDFSGTLKQVETFAERAKLTVELSLLNCQIETNNSVKDTNGSIIRFNDQMEIFNSDVSKTNEKIIDNNMFLKKIFGWTLFLTICGVFISGVTLFYARETNQREARKEDREVKSITSESLIQLKNSESAVLMFKNDSLKKIIDSLKNKISNASKNK